MDICVLSDEEIARLENYKLQPCHLAHKHIRLANALRKIAHEQMELVEVKGTLVGVRSPKLYYLRVKKSGGIGVVQRVKMNHPKHITPAPELELE